MSEGQVASEIKKCHGCSGVLPLSEFHPSPKTRVCKACAKRYQRKWNEKNKDSVAAIQKRSRIKNRQNALEAARRYYARDDIRHTKKAMRLGSRLKAFGLSISDFDEMFTSQGGKCAICGGTSGKRRLSVDHDHATGKVRSLLCTNCNSALGLLGESTERMASAIEYIKKHRAQS